MCPYHGQGNDRPLRFAARPRGAAAPTLPDWSVRCSRPDLSRYSGRGASDSPLQASPVERRGAIMRGWQRSPSLVVGNSGRSRSRAARRESAAAATGHGWRSSEDRFVFCWQNAVHARLTRRPYAKNCRRFLRAAKPRTDRPLLLFPFGVSLVFRAPPGARASQLYTLRHTLHCTVVLGPEPHAKSAGARPSEARSS